MTAHTCATSNSTALLLVMGLILLIGTAAFAFVWFTAPTRARCPQCNSTAIDRVLAVSRKGVVLNPPMDEGYRFCYACGYGWNERTKERPA